MNCTYCNSEALHLKKLDDKTGLYCTDCGRWQKWVSQEELDFVLKQLERKKNERVIDARDVKRVLETYRSYKIKHQALSDEIYYYNKYNTTVATEAEKTAVYAKMLKLKELTAKIAAYDEIIKTLQLNRI
jgi:hypothetical protein